MKYEYKTIDLEGTPAKFCVWSRGGIPVRAELVSVNGIVQRTSYAKAFIDHNHAAIAAALNVQDIT